MKHLSRNNILIAMSLTALTSMNDAYAFGSIGRQADTFCSNAGAPLAPQFQPGPLETTCDSCHNNGSGGGSGAGKSAAMQGNFEFFCPPPAPMPPPPPVDVCTDADGDGFNAEGGNCGPMDMNDNNANVFPGAPELCTDGVDNDGNGLVDKADPNAIGCPLDCTDNDADGYNIEGGACGPMDCDDSNPAINPGAEESCSDGIDNNCNGKVDSADLNAVGCPVQCTDNDADGYSLEGGACGPMDCNDDDPALNPGALEICGDNIDNNCDNKVDSADSACQAMSGDDKLQNMQDAARQKLESCKSDDTQDKKKIRKLKRKMRKMEMSANINMDQVFKVKDRKRRKSKRDRNEEDDD